MKIEIELEEEVIVKLKVLSGILYEDIDSIIEYCIFQYIGQLQDAFHRARKINEP